MDGDAITFRSNLAKLRRQLVQVQALRNRVRSAGHGLSGTVGVAESELGSAASALTRLRLRG